MFDRTSISLALYTSIIVFTTIRVTPQCNHHGNNKQRYEDVLISIPRTFPRHISYPAQSHSAWRRLEASTEHSTSTLSHFFYLLSLISLLASVFHFLPRPASTDFQILFCTISSVLSTSHVPSVQIYLC